MLEQFLNDRATKIILCSSLSFFSICCGIAIIRSSNLNLETANAKISLISQVSRAKSITSELATMAQSLEQQRQNYQDLKEKYDRLIATSPNVKLEKISPEIKKIESDEPLEIVENIATANEKIDKLQNAIDK